MAEGNLKELVKAFKALKFIPRIPVKTEEFISEENRRKWGDEKGMKAFTFINPRNPFENVDILLYVPISFGAAYQRKEWFQSGGVRIPVVAEADLILMKKKRPTSEQIMRRERKRRRNLWVSEEAIEDFQRLTSAQRLRWLDEMRVFLSKTLDPQTKRVFDEIRQGWPPDG